MAAPPPGVPAAGPSVGYGRIVRWIDYRLPFVAFLEHDFIEYPTPRNLNYWWNFGSLAGIFLVIMIVTGVVLAMHYTPHADLAFDSVERIMRDVNYGWLLRYIHMNGASMFFLIVYIHLFRGLYYGSYKYPRELLWILGVVILLLMIATAFIIDARGPQDTIPFHPYHTIKDSFGLCVALLVFAFFVFYAPDFAASADNYIPANPMVTPNHIVPEWYLLPYYAILRSITFDFLGIPSKLLGVLLSLGSLVILFFVPWLDTSRVRSARFRPIYRWVAWILPIDVIALGYVGSQPPAGFVVTLGQVATFYYYLHFLVLMPLLGKLERTRPLPISIGTAVLEATGRLGATGSVERH